MQLKKLLAIPERGKSKRIINKIVSQVCKYFTPISWAFKKNKENIFYPLKTNANKIRSQDLTKNYYHNSICITFSLFKKKKTIKSDKNYFSLKFPKIRFVDIDDLKYWKIV